MDESAWASIRAKEVRERHGKERQLRQALALENNLKRTLGPPLWTTIRKMMKSRIDSFNQALGEGEVLLWISGQPNEVVVQVGTSDRQISASFDPEKLRITCYNMIGAMTVYEAEVLDGSVVFSEESSGPVAPESIAEKFADSIIDHV